MFSPAPKITLFNFQKQSVNFAKNRKRVLIAEDLGLGKSPIALNAICNNQLINHLLIVCPKILSLQWKKTCDKFLVAPTVKVLKTPTDLTKDNASVKIVHYELFKKLPINYFKDFDAIIFDEAHRLKTFRPDTYRLGVKSKSSQVATKYLEVFNIKNYQKILLLTGTPLFTSVKDLYIFYWSCNQHNSGHYSFYEFLHYFCYSKPNQYSGGLDYYGVRNSDKLIKIFYQFTTRHSKYEVADQINFNFEINHQNLYVEFPTERFGRLWDEFLEYETGSAVNEISEKKAAAIYKAKSTVDYAKNILEENNNNKILIFTEHPDAARFIAIKLECDYICGDIKPEERINRVNKFQNLSECNFLVATLGTMAYGVNLQFCNTVIFNDLSYTPAINDQAIGRVVRIGQELNCNIYYVTGTGVDEKINGILLNKQSITKEIFN